MSWLQEGRPHAPRAALGASILTLSIPASYVLGAMTLVFLLTGGVLLGSSLPVGSRAIRLLATLLAIGLALSLFSLYVQVVE